MQRRSSPQDISWFLDLRSNNQLDLDPPYQRRSVWNRKDRQFFLDTVFRGYPCPPVYLHKTVNSDQKTIYAVVDGKQRLQTLFKFVDGEFSLSNDFGDDRLNGKFWRELTDERKLLWDYVIPAEFLTFDPNDTRVVSQAFDRLNRNMRKLESQELRHARWDGWFITLVEKEADDALWKTFGLVTNARSKRMKDAQFLSELLLLLIEHKQHGFDQDHLDAGYAKYDDIDEAELDLDPDEVSEQLTTAKAYLNEMQSVNGCVKEAGRTLAAFYTLWAVVVLHRPELLPSTDFAVEFADFMGKVNELKAADDPTSILSGSQGEAYRLPNDFLQGYLGATTDLAPRARRLTALLSFVRGQ